MLSKDDIARLLHELADELEAQGIHGDLFLVGGAAMALAYSARRATRHLDAVFEPKQVIYEAYLFAMKMLATRVERDADDIEVLYRLSGFRTVDEALDHVQPLYPHQPVPPKAQYLLQELFPSG
jgi:hypothetical protein